VSVAIPKIAVTFGSVAPPQGDAIELRVHLGCTKEVSSFDCLLQNFDKKYTVTNLINVGDDCHFDIGRGDDVPLILTGRVEEVEPESTPVENYIRVRGRCWGEKIFRRVVTETYENKKGEEIIRDLIDYYVGLSHTREKSDLTSDASSGQKDVAVADASIFSVGDLVKIEDDNAWEYNEVSAVDTGTNTLTMVNNLQNTYTVAANGKVWIDLIEKTDTTYTLLEYKDAKVFDILKYIAESADKSGVIGFDFRVEYDGKFTFFPKNSKTSPISLSEKIEHSRYSKDIHRVRNKIMVYGAAEKPYPLDTDSQPWSDSLTEDLTKPNNYLQHADGKWEPLIPAHETVSIGTTTVHTGSKSVKIQSGSYDYYMGIHFTFDANKHVNSNRYPKLGFTLREDNHHNKRITIGLTDKDGNDCWQSVDIADYDEWQSYTLGVGKQNQEAWTLGNSEFDWENIKTVRFDFHQKTNQYGVAYVDRLHFGGCRWNATEEDSDSQSSYGLRELTETDEELHSGNECSLRGKALLNHLSQPAEFLTLRTTCLDYGTDRLLPGDKIHVTLPNENIDSDFRIISVEYRVTARDQTLEITLELGKEKPLLADYLYGLRSTTVTVEKLMRTKAGLTGLVGSGGGGGGGGGGDGGSDEKVKVSSTDTTTDYLVEKLLAGEGITLMKKSSGADEDLEIKSHRRWAWTDELSWIHLIVLPFSRSNGWTKHAANPVITKSGTGWREVGVQHPCLIRKLVDGYKYWCFLTGMPSGETWKSKSIAVLKSNDLITWIETGISNPLIEVEAGTWKSEYILNPAVIYDRWESDENKRWKMWFIGSNTAGGDDSNKIGYAYAQYPYGPWTEHASNPIYTPPNDITWGLSVFRISQLFYMVYATAGGGALKHATSSDGISWSEGMTILSGGGAGAWDYSVRYCSIYSHPSGFYLAYTGGDATSPNVMKIGLAVKTNPFQTFDSFPYNPVLSVGSSGSWDDEWVWNPSMIMEESAFGMLYGGRKDSTGERSIGYAYLPPFEV
jgi:hypothetical protein